MNSHTHPDHIGGNYEFKKILGTTTPFTKKNTAGFTSSDVAGWAEGDNICGKLPPNFDGSKYQIHPFRISEFVKDHQVIDLGARHLEILFTPGHTPDSLCLLDRDNRLLFTGDTFYPGPIYLFSPETDFPAYEKSVALLASLVPNVDLLLPAHNLPVAAPHKLLELNEAVHEVEKGAAHFADDHETREYKFNGFSLLMRKPQP